jgi:DNA-binding XRE family transcriptional regulator
MKDRLRVIRAERGTTQWQLKLMTGINQTYLSMAENDQIVLTPEQKKKVARALGVSVQEIWEDGC